MELSIYQVITIVLTIFLFFLGIRNLSTYRQIENSDSEEDKKDAARRVKIIGYWSIGIASVVTIYLGWQVYNHYKGKTVSSHGYHKVSNEQRPSSSCSSRYKCGGGVSTAPVNARNDLARALSYVR